MITRHKSMLFAVLLFLGWLVPQPAAAAGPTSAARTVPDPRNIANDRVIPSEGYADQPYIVKTETERGCAS